MSSLILAELSDIFSEFGDIYVKRMFGGHGIWHQGRMFAIVYGEALYLKADALTREAFASRGLGKIQTRDGREIPIEYYAAPAEVLEDRDEAARWARTAFEAALRAPPARKKKKKPRRAARTAQPGVPPER